MTSSKKPATKKKRSSAKKSPPPRIEVDPTPNGKPWYVVRRSKVHGTGIFAARNIPAGTRVIEYLGEHISSREADRRHPVNPDDPFHTFFFAISSGKIIDGGSMGNDARWINHSCEPNCESEETDADQVFVVSLQPIARGEELNYDYGLVIDERLTPKLKKSYLCMCGAPSCRGTMLALKQPKKKKAAKKKKEKTKADSGKK